MMPSDLFHHLTDTALVTFLLGRPHVRNSAIGLVLPPRVVPWWSGSSDTDGERTSRCKDPVRRLQTRRCDWSASVTFTWLFGPSSNSARHCAKPIGPFSRATSRT